MAFYNNSQNFSTTYGSFFTKTPHKTNKEFNINMIEKNKLPNLPNLPGHVFSDPYKQNHKKHQAFELKTNTCTEKTYDFPNHKEHNDKEIRDIEDKLKNDLNINTKGYKTTNSFYNSYHNSNKNQSMSNSNSDCLNMNNFKTTYNSFYNNNNTKHIRDSLSIYNESYPRILPQWVKYNDAVLKFYGYFNEHVIETVGENYRSRKVHIYYYLSDDTIHIDEIKEENSGLPQGYFLKRHRIINKETNDYYHWSELNLRKDIFIYGKKFRIYNCDEFTKKFYSENAEFYNNPSLKLNNPEEFIPPKKIEDISNVPNRDGSTVESRREENLKNIADYKEYVEVKLKGGHPNKNLKQFLENDRKVLNFNILWFDEKYDKEEKPYIMNYYLADNMVEVREIKINNSGKDNFPYLLRKCKLPKKPKFSYCPGLLNNRIDNNNVYYTPQDLVLGNYINIYNRNCLIYDCDDFTKQWFKHNLNIDMEPIRLKKNPPQQIIHPIPPHNGYGSEEDSLLSVYYLTPVNRIRDMIKMFKQDKHIMRFYSKLISPIASDSERSFIVSVFCRDDSIQIFEMAGKNSGRQSCKFMERQKVKNPFTNKYYSQKDFLKGKNIYINKFTFRLLECDEYTKKYMIDNPEIFKDSSLETVVSRIRGGACNYKNIEDYAVEFIKKVDPNCKHYVSKDIINDVFKK